MKINRKPRICRLIFEFLPDRPGGSVTHTIELAKYMQPHLEKQYVLVPKTEENVSELDRDFGFEVNRVNYYKFEYLHKLKARYVKWLPLAPFLALSYGLFAIPRIMRINRKYGIDIIHAHGLSTGMIACITGRLLRKPAVWTLHGTLESYSKISAIYERIITWLFRPDRAFVVDNGGPALSRFRELLAGDILIPVFINIDPDKFLPKPADMELSDRLKIGDKFVFISVHSLTPVQGVENAILAFSEFLQFENNPDAVLLVIGDNGQREYLEQLTRKLGMSDRIKFPGRIDNIQVPDYLSVADVALSTSTRVNMNNSTIEAMACGKPVIAFDCGNTSDRLIQNMETGLFARSGDIHDLAAKMLKLYREPELREKIGKQARQFIISHRTWERRIKTELEVYEKLLHGK